MARSGGNPEFGTKYVAPQTGPELLSKKPFNIRLPQSDYDALMAIPSKKRASLVREAISKALKELESQS
ncbi:MAG: hypothetical protein F6K09_01115 [Merismopedia sp. SIO2A8]|nr:hypothetical protein [Symploca sp. SIO2B6]NET47328.1 hypothetical protein [Merismopedia sp. SIO2A8]